MVQDVELHDIKLAHPGLILLQTDNNCTPLMCRIKENVAEPRLQNLNVLHAEYKQNGWQLLCVHMQNKGTGDYFCVPLAFL